MAECNTRNPLDLGELDPSQIIECGLAGGRFRTDSMSPLDIVLFITNQLAYIGYLLCLVGFAVGLINVITSAGDKTKLSNGKNILMLSGLAIIIILLAQNILIIVMNIFGFKPSY